MLVACVPWYAVAHGMSQGAWAGSPTDAPFFIQAMIAFPSIIASRLGMALLLPALLGIWMTVIRPWRSRRVSAEWAALASLAFVTLLLHCIVPASIEPRFMVTLMPSLLLFTAAGAYWFADRLSDRWGPRALRPALLFGIAILFMVETFEMPIRLRNSGYEAVVKEAAGRLSSAPQVYLVASDPIGEGSTVAAVALAERRPHNVLLRGSKIFVREDWMGRGTEDRFESSKEISDLLDRMPVNVVIVDDAMPTPERRPYHDRVKETVSEDKRTWELARSLPVVRLGRLHENALHVYVRRFAEAPSAPKLAINFDLLRELTRRDPHG